MRIFPSPKNSIKWGPGVTANWFHETEYNGLIFNNKRNLPELKGTCQTSIFKLYASNLDLNYLNRPFGHLRSILFVIQYKLYSVEYINNSFSTRWTGWGNLYAGWHWYSTGARWNSICHNALSFPVILWLKTTLIFTTM